MLAALARFAEAALSAVTDWSQFVTCLGARLSLDDADPAGFQKQTNLAFSKGRQATSIVRIATGLATPPFMKSLSWWARVDAGGAHLTEGDLVGRLGMRAVTPARAACGAGPCATPAGGQEPLYLTCSCCVGIWVAMSTARAVRYRKLALASKVRSDADLLLKLADERDSGLLCTAEWLSARPSFENDEPQKAGAKERYEWGPPNDRRRWSLSVNRGTEAVSKKARHLRRAQVREKPPVEAAIATYAILASGVCHISQI
jgi:hypothetical protein